MKKIFLKSVAATAVVASVMALSSVAVFATDATLDLTDTEWSAKSEKKTQYTSTDKVFEVRHNGTASGATGYKFDKNAKTDIASSSETSSFYIKFHAEAGDYVKAYVNCGSNNKKIQVDLIKANSDGVLSSANVYDSQSDTVNKTSNTEMNFKQIEEEGDYCIITSNNVSEATGLFKGVELKSGSLTGFTYDEDSFGEETKDNTVYVAGSEASATLNAQTIQDAEPDADFTQNYTITADAEYGGFTFVGGGTGKEIKLYPSGTFALGGTGRPVTFAVPANSVVKVSGIISTGDDARTLALGTSTSDTSFGTCTAPAKGSDPVAATFTVEKASTCYLYSKGSGINFTSIEVYPGVEVNAPAVTLTKVDGASDRVTFKGVINGDADDSLEVTAIKVVTAKGYDKNATKLDAVSHDITKVAEDGSDYAFLVTVDKTAADASGLEIQASVEYDNNGETAASYSAVVEYAAAE